MNLNQTEISFLIGRMLASGEITLNELESEGIDLELLSSKDVTIHDYEGSREAFDDFKIRLVKKLYSQFQNQQN